MNINDGRLVALTGAMLAEGTFAFRGVDTDGFRKPRNPMVGVQLAQGSHHKQFNLYDSPTRDSDGFWTATSALHSVTLLGPMPSLDRLIDYPSFGQSPDPEDRRRMKVHMSADNSAFAWVALDQHYSPPIRPALTGTAAAITVEASREGDALAFKIALRVDEPVRGDLRSSPFDVEVTARLNLATLALAGSRLLSSVGAGQWSQSDADRQVR